MGRLFFGTAHTPSIRHHILRLTRDVKSVGSQADNAQDAWYFQNKTDGTILKTDQDQKDKLRYEDQKASKDCKYCGMKGICRKYQAMKKIALYIRISDQSEEKITAEMGPDCRFFRYQFDDEFWEGKRRADL